jgi:hypothetical protein
MRVSLIIRSLPMLQRVIAAYQRIASFPNWSLGTRFFPSAARRRSVPLNVLVLEERATPAGTDSFLPPIHPHVAVLVAPFPTVFIQTQPQVDNGSAAIASVRSDLFGPGDAGKPETADELEEMLANEHASKEDVKAEVPRQGTDAAEQAEVTRTADTVVIEGMVYLPPVD